jgi:hypothetical protein
MGGASTKLLEQAQKEAASAKEERDQAEVAREAAVRELADEKQKTKDAQLAAYSAAKKAEVAEAEKQSKLAEMQATKQALLLTNQQLEETLKVMRRKQEKRLAKLAARAFGRGINGAAGSLGPSAGAEVSDGGDDDASVLSEASQDTMMVQLANMDITTDDLMYSTLADKIKRLEGRLEAEKTDKLKLSETLLMNTNSVLLANSAVLGETGTGDEGGLIESMAALGEVGAGDRVGDVGLGQGAGGSLSEFGRVRDYVVIVDSSASMRLVDRSLGVCGGFSAARSRWELAQEALELLVPRVVERDNDGITIYFFSSGFTKHEHVCSAQHVQQLFRDVKPRGGTRLAPVLADAMAPYCAHKNETDEDADDDSISGGSGIDSAGGGDGARNEFGGGYGDVTPPQPGRGDANERTGRQEENDKQRGTDTVSQQTTLEKEVSREQGQAHALETREQQMEALEKRQPQQRQKDKARWASRHRAKQPSKPSTLLVVTDGAPDNRGAVEEEIRRASNSLIEHDDLRILFVQIGTDKGAQRWLEALDQNLECKADIVDTMGFGELRRTGIPFAQWVARSIMADVLM